MLNVVEMEFEGEKSEIFFPHPFHQILIFHLQTQLKQKSYLILNIGFVIRLFVCGNFPSEVSQIQDLISF